MKTELKLTAATLLDPRFKDRYFNVQETEYVTGVVLAFMRYQFEQVSTMTHSRSEVDCHVNQPSTSAASAGTGLLDEYDKFVSVDPQMSDSGCVVFVV